MARLIPVATTKPSTRASRMPPAASSSVNSRAGPYELRISVMATFASARLLLGEKVDLLRELVDDGLHLLLVGGAPAGHVVGEGERQELLVLQAEVVVDVGVQLRHRIARLGSFADAT